VLVRLRGFVIAASSRSYYFHSQGRFRLNLHAEETIFSDSLGVASEFHTSSRSAIETLICRKRKPKASSSDTASIVVKASRRKFALGNSLADDDLYILGHIFGSCDIQQIISDSNTLSYHPSA